jgi:hypothetical protein
MYNTSSTILNKGIEISAVAFLKTSDKIKEINVCSYS